MSMLVSFVLSFFPRDVLDGILNLIGSVSEGFPSYSLYKKHSGTKLDQFQSMVLEISSFSYLCYFQ